MKKHKIETMDIRGLMPAKYNPRTISEEAMKGLQASIKRFGLVQPIVWNRQTRHVVGGHQRLKALLAEGEKTADVVIVDIPLTEEKALNITLNNPAIAGDFTDDLQDVLNDLKEAIPEAFSQLRLDELIGDLANTNCSDPDDAPPVPKKASTKIGELYQLGGHRLLCGDSSKPGTFEKLMGSERARLCFSDPPYGIDYGAKNRFLNSFLPSGRNSKDIANDMIGKDELFDMLVAAFTSAREYSRDDCSFYVTAPQGGELGLMMMMMMMSGLPVRHVLIWNKDSQNFSLGRLDYEYKHEPILYCWKKKHRFFGNGQFTNSVWDIPKPKKAAEHPTMKPVELVENAILNSTQRGDLMIDMFCGSGTSIIAAEKTGRRCFGMEIDPLYCDVIVNRWQTFTGGKAKRG